MAILPRNGEKIITVQLKQRSPFYNQAEAKLLINIFLNTSAENAIRLIKTHTLFPPADVLNFFRKLDTLRPLLADAALRHGCDLSLAEAKNRAFFALEFLEQRYLRHLLQELNQLIALQSLVLVHDGFYQDFSARA